MATRKHERARSGQFALAGLDRVLHEKARLGILSSLMAHPEGLLFTELKELCSLTDGNLNRHMQVLQDAELVEVWKGNQGKRLQTLIRMTANGRERFMEYIGVLEQVVSDAIAASQTRQNPAQARRGLSWCPP
jgi:DNA-binding MarR family transcriptional regulator